MSSDFSSRFDTKFQRQVLALMFKDPVFRKLCADVPSTDLSTRFVRIVGTVQIHAESQRNLIPETGGNIKVLDQ